MSTHATVIDYLLTKRIDKQINSGRKNNDSRLMANDICTHIAAILITVFNEVHLGQPDAQDFKRILCRLFLTPMHQCTGMFDDVCTHSANIM